eukprot:NODE_2828_length_463_cov_31.487923_g2233_i0.p1 GENE.NODE_2828_length_463_cov_31.487923_g2233_i0~~NODE_2828_length_463_cov_31.487923_g2233_i0.p1  ORF type:complete len:106 (+),score=25.18 NODE_2828_length_463_cov_31.487923_g2233_i0:143-460(+)
MATTSPADAKPSIRSLLQQIAEEKAAVALLRGQLDCATSDKLIECNLPSPLQLPERCVSSDSPFEDSDRLFMEQFPSYHAPAPVSSAPPISPSYSTSSIPPCTLR